MAKHDMSSPYLQKALESVPENGFLVWCKDWPMSVEVYESFIGNPKEAAKRFGYDDIEKGRDFNSFDVLVYSDRTGEVIGYKVSLSYVVEAERVDSDG